VTGFAPPWRSILGLAVVAACHPRPIDELNVQEQRAFFELGNLLRRSRYVIGAAVAWRLLT